MNEKTHFWPVRVYYEDTDLGGIVYYANYLKFIERGRSEWLRALGIDQLALKQSGHVFAVRHLEADYLAPAVYDDMLCVATHILKRSPARLVLQQLVSRDEKTLFSAKVTIVCLGPDLRPARLPADLHRAMAPYDAGADGILT